MKVFRIVKFKVIKISIFQKHQRHSFSSFNMHFKFPIWPHFFFLPLHVLLVHLQMTACAAARWAEKNTGKQTVHGGYSSTQGEAAGIQIHRHTDTYTVNAYR